MFKRILVPTDGTERTAGALAVAVRLAQLGGGCVVGLHAPPRTGPLSAGLDGEMRDLDANVDANADAASLMQEAQDALAYVNRCARVAAVPCETVRAGAGPPHEAIIQAARDHRCDLIVLTMRSRHGLATRLLSGTTQRVLANSAIPVLVVRPP